jgi:hypothetical protein
MSNVDIEIVEDEEMIEEEKKILEEEKSKVKKQCMSLYNKYKRKREGDEDVGEYKVYKRRSVPGNFQYGCNFWQMMKRPSMKSTINIRPSSLDNIKDWK